jgi:SAM-dependent methyltransferase
MTKPYVFAADTLLRFRDGRILIHTTTSPLPAFETDNPMLIGWLCQLARPVTLEAALTTLPAADRPAVAEILDYLKRGGALVEADSGAAHAPAAASLESATRGHLRTLARSFYDLACDLLGYGAFAEQELRSRGGMGVERQLMALLAAVDGLRTELGAIRVPFLTRQLSALGVGANSRDLKLHIGCGKGLLDGWVNIDISPAPLAMNVLWGLPFKDQSVDVVFVSHLLEHLFFPRDVKAFLAELRRVLAPEGIVRLVVPDVEKCIEAYRMNDRKFFESRRETWSWWPENPTRLEDFLGYAGAGAEPAYLFESHKYGYDFETLQRVLADAGFENIVRSKFMGSAHPSLRVDEISAVAKAKYGAEFYSLFVEAMPAKSVVG